MRGTPILGPGIVRDFRSEARNLDQLIIWITQSLDLRLRSPAARWRNGQVLLMMAMLALYVSHLAAVGRDMGATGLGRGGEEARRGRSARNSRKFERFMR